MNHKNTKILTLSLLLTFVFISILSISRFILNSQIINSEADYNQRQLTDLLATIKFNNVILDSKNIVNDSQNIKYYYLAKYNDTPTAAIVNIITPDGYNGDISLLVAIELNQDNNNQIINTKILHHQETPGLGDLVEPEKSDWLKKFSNANKNNIDNIDTITGATITSKAVKSAINDALLYTQNNI